MTVVIDSLTGKTTVNGDVWSPESVRKVYREYRPHKIKNPVHDCDRCTFVEACDEFKVLTNQFPWEVTDDLDLSDYL